MIEEIPSLEPWEAAIVAQIASERATRRIPVKELAKRVGIHPNSMPRYMSGERQLTIGMVERFIVALGMDRATFLRRVEQRVEEVGRPDLELASGGLDDTEPDATDGQ